MFSLPEECDGQERMTITQWWNQDSNQKADSVDMVLMSMWYI